VSVGVLLDAPLSRCSAPPTVPHHLSPDNNPKLRMGHGGTQFPRSFNPKGRCPPSPHAHKKVGRKGVRSLFLEDSGRSARWHGGWARHPPAAGCHIPSHGI